MSKGVNHALNFVGGDKSWCGIGVFDGGGFGE